MIEVTVYVNDKAHDTAEAETAEAALSAARCLLRELPKIQGVTRTAYVVFCVDGEVIRRCSREAALTGRTS